MPATRAQASAAPSRPAVAGRKKRSGPVAANPSPQAMSTPTASAASASSGSTLPARERAAGLAEVVKIALIQDATLLEALERNADALRAGDRAALRPIVRAAIEAKIRVVRDDELEDGARALLNLGHTVGHALEAHGGFTLLLHGEAVAVGTVLEMGASERLGFTPAGLAARAQALFERLDLPTRPADAGDLAAAWHYVMSDKKRAATTVKLPVVTGPGRGSVARVELAVLRDALLA